MIKKLILITCFLGLQNDIYGGRNSVSRGRFSAKRHSYKDDAVKGSKKSLKILNRERQRESEEVRRIWDTGCRVVSGIAIVGTAATLWLMNQEQSHF